MLPGFDPYQDVSFKDRALLAFTWLIMRSEERENFLSDSDLLTAADLFTVDPVYGYDEDPADRDREDYHELVYELDTQLQDRA
jgi:hypothetical protein